MQITLQDLPAVDAILNGTSAVLMTFGFVFIRAKRVTAHRTCMVAAFVVSAAFLVCYVTYHLQAAPHPFGGRGVIRSIYFSLLISHIILAIIIVPLVITTLVLALRSNIARHRKFAAWTFPLWYYVSITGVLVYMSLYRWWPGSP